MQNQTQAKYIVAAVIFYLLFPLYLCAEENQDYGRSRKTTKTWSPFVQGGFVSRFNADLENGDEFSANRFFVRTGAGYSPDYMKNISLSLGYNSDRYDFSGNTGIAALEPWERIDTFSFSIPVRWGIDEQWMVFVVPTMRFVAENDADWDNALSGGGFAGFSYRVNDRLSIGPGIGILSQIEDNASIFPVLIINWKITERLSFETGRGLGATMGPGLFLNWKADEKWTFSCGGRYEKLRFRLDDKGYAANGVGEDRVFPVLIGCSYSPDRNIQMGVYGGTELGGKLSFYDENGGELLEEDYDPSAVVGLTFNVRF